MLMRNEFPKRSIWIYTWYVYHIPNFKSLIIHTQGMVRKDKIIISVEHDLIKWLDKQIENKRFCSRSHGFEYAFLQLKQES